MWNEMSKCGGCDAQHRWTWSRGVRVFLLEVSMQCLGFQGFQGERGWGEMTGSPGDEAWEERWEDSLGWRRCSAHLLPQFTLAMVFGLNHNVNWNTFVRLRVSDCWSEGWLDLLPRSSAALKLASAQVTLSSDSFFIPGSISPYMCLSTYENLGIYQGCFMLHDFLSYLLSLPCVSPINS